MTEREQEAWDRAACAVLQCPETWRQMSDREIEQHFGRNVHNVSRERIAALRAGMAADALVAERAKRLSESDNAR